MNGHDQGIVEPLSSLIAELKNDFNSEMLSNTFKICLQVQKNGESKIVNTWTATSTILCAFNLEPLTISSIADPDS